MSLNITIRAIGVRKELNNSLLIHLPRPEHLCDRFAIAANDGFGGPHRSDDAPRSTAAMGRSYLSATGSPRPLSSAPQAVCARNSRFSELRTGVVPGVKRK